MEGEEEKALTSRSIERVIERYGREANLPELTPHVLRHTFAKNLIDKGMGLEKVAALLGHASLNTTHILCSAKSKGPGRGSGFVGWLRSQYRYRMYNNYSYPIYIQRCKC